VLVEIQSWDSVTVYSDVATSVDAMLRYEEPQPEQRSRDADGQLHITTPPPRDPDSMPPALQRRPQIGPRGGTSDRRPARTEQTASPRISGVHQQRIFPFGVSRNRLEDAIARLHVPAVIVRDMQDATLVMTQKSHYRQSAQRLRQAEERGVPVYVLRNNTITQIERQLAHIFQLRIDDDDEQWAPHFNENNRLEHVLLDTETAITEVMNGERDMIELSPQNSYIRRLQHQLADRYNLRSESHGSEPHRRVRISR
jgi:hypothetical protein